MSVRLLLGSVPYAVLSLRRHPGWIIIAALSLAPAIGLTSAVFSFVKAVLLEPFPYRDPDSIVLLWGSDNQASSKGISGPDLMDWRRDNRVFDDIVPFVTMPVVLGQEPEDQVSAAIVGWSLFRLLGVSPLMGRPLTEIDGSPGEHVAVLSYSFWQHRMGGADDACGRLLRVNGVLYSVVAVMPKDLFFPDVDVQLWLSLPSDWAGLDERGHPLVHAVARLRHGVTIDDARANLALINMRLASAYPDTNNNVSAGLFHIHDVVVGQYRTASLALLASMCVIVLLACANVTTLLFARGRARERSLALQAAFGARRIDIIVQLMTENMIIGATAGIIGVIIAEWTIEYVKALQLVGIPRLDKANINCTVLLFTAAISAASSVAFGLFPAIRSTRTILIESLKLGGTASTHTTEGRVDDVLMSIEVALTMTLVLMAGMFVQHFERLAGAKWGFESDHTLVVDVALPVAMRSQELPQREFIDTVLSRLSNIPGVKSVAMGFGVPVRWSQWKGATLAVDGHIVTTDWVAAVWTVSSGFFRTLKIPVIKGREFEDGDDRIRPSGILLSEALARRLWPGGDALGKSVTFAQLKSVNGELPVNVVRRIHGHDRSLYSDTSVWEMPEPGRQVIGIVGNVKMFGLDIEPPPALYVDYRLQPAIGTIKGSITPKFLIRTVGGPEHVAATAKRVISSVEPRAGLTAVASMDDLVMSSIGGRGSNRFLLVISTMFGGLALWLSMIGVYGVTTHAVTTRTSEVGIRLALGATRGDIIRLFGIRGAAMMAIGIGGGLGAAFLMTRYIASTLYGLALRDPVVLSGSVILTTVVAVAASAYPLIRATHIDPQAVCRSE